MPRSWEERANLVRAMRSARWDCRWQPLPRRCCAGVTLACYLLTAFNVPLPVPAAARKPGDPPFPCQDHGCGCQSAQQCWASCCCLTPEQRWAWAREHQVEPPTYAERPASAGWSTTRLRDREPPTTKPAKKPCCAQSEPTPTGSSCCSGHTPVTGSSSTAPAPKGEQKQPESKGHVHWISTVAALKCQGHSTLWAASGAALPPGAPLTWAPCLTSTGQLCSRDDFFDNLRPPPASPPPRPSPI